MAERYAASPVSNPDAYQRKLDMTRAHLTPASIVYEFGCGTGSTALALAKAAREICASDISEAMLAIARRKAEEAGVENVRFVRGAIENAPFDDESVDAVLGFSILHLLHDPDAAIRKAYALLRPGGVFVSNTACIAETMPFFALIAPIGRALGRMPYVRVFKKPALIAMLEGAGFEIIERFEPSRMVFFAIARKPSD